MITQLLNKTNEEDFYQNWNLKLESVNGIIESYQKNNFEINLCLKSETENSNQEYWQILANQVLEIKDIFSPEYLPYIKLSILEDHPLLWKFKYDDLECELSGNLQNHHEFTSKLHWLYEEQTGGFIEWKRDFYELSNLIKGKDKIPISMNLKTYNFVKNLTDEFGLINKIVTISSNEDKGYLNKPNAKILFFGNPDVAPNNENLRQPYIIADEFTAKKRTI